MRTTTGPGSELDADLEREVYAEGQGAHAVEPDPFDEVIGAHRNPVVGECAECEVEHHQDDLFTCAACAQTLCEQHLDEEEHTCTPHERDEDE